MKLSSTQKPKKKSRHPSSNPSVGITTLLSVRWWLIPAALHSKRADGGWQRHKPELFHSLHTAEFPSKAAVTPNPPAAVRECHSMVRVWDVLGTLMISSSKNNSKQPGWGWSDRSNLLLTRLSRSFKAFLNCKCVQCNKEGLLFFFCVLYWESYKLKKSWIWEILITSFPDWLASERTAAVFF